MNLQETLAKLPKAELHLHLEGSIEPATLAELAARHGDRMSAEEVKARYNFRDFAGFLDAFKWVTAYVRQPKDYELIAGKLADHLVEQGVVYAEVTLSAGVMRLRKQDAASNFAAVQEVARRASNRGLKIAWVVDAVRQFGPEAAMDVARCAAQLRDHGVVAFGMGGDELALPAEHFRGVYDFVRSEGLHCLVHAGEIGGPKSVREAVEMLGAERIGHGIAAAADTAVVELLVKKRIPLEICPTSNLRTGALARLLGKPDATIAEHPIRSLFEQGVPVTVSTDDPAMFRTSLNEEYALLAQVGFSPAEIARVARQSFEAAFLGEGEKRKMLDGFDSATRAAGLI